MFAVTFADLVCVDEDSEETCKFVCPYIVEIYIL